MNGTGTIGAARDDPNRALAAPMSHTSQRNVSGPLAVENPSMAGAPISPVSPGGQWNRPNPHSNPQSTPGNSKTSQYIDKITSENDRLRRELRAEKLARGLLRVVFGDTRQTRVVCREVGIVVAVGLAAAPVPLQLVRFTRRQGRRLRHRVPGNGPRGLAQPPAVAVEDELERVGAVLEEMPAVRHLNRPRRPGPDVVGPDGAGASLAGAPAGGADRGTPARRAFVGECRHGVTGGRGS